MDRKKKNVFNNTRAASAHNTHYSARVRSIAYGFLAGRLNKNYNGKKNPK